MSETDLTNDLDGNLIIIFYYVDKNRDFHTIVLFTQ